MKTSAEHRVGLAFAASGVALLVLGQQGGFAALRVNPLGVTLALVSAVSYSYYMLDSPRLVRSLGAGATTAWGLSITGVVLIPWAQPWHVHPTGDPVTTTALVLFMVVGATALAFSFSMARLRRISPTESAITSTTGACGGGHRRGGPARGRPASAAVSGRWTDPARRGAAGASCAA